MVKLNRININLIKYFDDHIDDKITGWIEGGIDDIWDDGEMTGEPEEPEEPEEWSEWSWCSEDCKRRRSRNGDVDEEYCKPGVDDCKGKV